MLKTIVLFLFVAWCQVSFAQHTPANQNDTSWKKEYRETPARINNLIHTKLDVKPDFSKSWLYGKAWITLMPHFYPTDSLTLDAKGIEGMKKAFTHMIRLIEDVKYSSSEPFE